MPDFKVTCAPILELPRSAEVIIDGGVNATNAAALKDKLSASLDRKITYVSILMGNVAYVNSSGFGYFMDLAGMLERRGGALVLVEVQPKVKVVFNNLGMQNFFRFELSDENARAFLRGQAGLAQAPLEVDADLAGGFVDRREVTKRFRHLAKFTTRSYISIS